MAEIARAAQVAMRSASLLRTTTPTPTPATTMLSRPSRSLVFPPHAPRCPPGRRHMSATSSWRSPNEPARPTPPSAVSPTSAAKTQQQKSYASYNWGSPRRVSDADILNPTSPSYNLAFGGKKGSENKKDEAGRDFASDFDLSLGLELTDFKINAQDRPRSLPPPKTYLRMVPRTGRTIHVSGSVDVARSFKMLAVQVSQNNTRRDSQTQRFHERPGLKRKRLKSERWQARFKKGFKATVSRVRQLTAQGW
ncbi:hypothetical protein F4808DRAFT_412215 [Astrocystis sublimbata]|nr:hypothetical protein F4808DRAFT_412215 [Astrocystis sublimbata]